MPIWKQALLRRLHKPEDDAGGGGGGGGGGGDDVQAKIDAAVAAAVTGLKAKNGELLGKVREQADSLKRFDGIDPDAVRNILKRFSDDEEAALIAKGEVDKVLEKRTERMQADFNKKLAEAESRAEANAKRSKTFEARVLDAAILKSATKVGIHEHAVEDALFRGRSMFVLDDDGNAVQLGEDGKPVLGKDGKSPFTPEEWLEGMKEKAPHWFPASGSGGGAGGSGSGGHQSAQELMKLSPVERLNAARGAQRK
ncbi:MAG: hypothetical protein IPJ61_18610 [Tessaracoccus sp.]|uniref:hypothetical protein n=1 Tax=Tessaracoccus sp. TaxID=1971211 RepID=UPI001ED1702E|nr:hypothetical protein [Tessaracoccus sp.]MBK7822997.1 hypothetical protein [Tessaracoccus sp.]